MPISNEEQEPCSTTIYDVIVEATKLFSAKKHKDRGLPQICEAATNKFEILYSPCDQTNLPHAQMAEFMSDYNDNPNNTFARISVDDTDVTRYIQREEDDLVAYAIELEGKDEFWERKKLELQVYSVQIALEYTFGGYEPEPGDKHYRLWKEFYRLTAAGIEGIRDEACADRLVYEDNEDAIASNAKEIEKWESLKARDKKAYAELQSRLLLAEITYHRQTGTAAMMRTSHRTPHRAKRASAGHGAASRAGDDGDGDGDGEPPRPRSPHAPTPPLCYSLTHSLIFAGGAQ